MTHAECTPKKQRGSVWPSRGRTVLRGPCLAALFAVAFVATPAAGEPTTREFQLARTAAAASAATPAAAGESATRERQLARTAAAADRHDEALRHFHRAVRYDSSLAYTLGLEIGDQYTWADKPDSALAWYDRFLSTHPGNVDALLGKARALSWTDRHDAAITIYRAVLPRAQARRAEVYSALARVTSWKDQHRQALAFYDSALAIDPNFVEAQNGRAQVFNWSGRHRTAARMYRDLLATHPGNDDARVGLAHAYLWMDRPDQARTIAEDGGHDALRKMAREIRRGRAPLAGYSFSRTTDSDDIQRDRHGITATAMPGMLSSLHVQFDRWAIEQPQLPGITRDQLRAGVRHRFTTSLALNAVAGYEWNRFATATAQPFTTRDNFGLLLIDTYATLTPRDWVRADLGVSRGSIENPEPVFRAIAYTDYSAGLDWRFSPSLLASASASYTDYTDDNTKFASSARAEFTPTWQPPIGIRNRWKFTTSAGYLSFSRFRDHGYFNPDQYVTLYEYVEGTFTLSRRLALALGGRLGAEREDAGDWFSTGSIDGNITMTFDAGLSVSAGFYNTKSRLDTRSGYQADGWYVGAGYRFYRKAVR